MTSSTETSSRRGVLILAVAFTMVAWASAFVIIRGVAPFVGGGGLALGRLAVGVIALGILVLARRKWVAPTGREWVRLAVYGVAWFAAYNVTLNLAEHTLDAGTTSMIVNIGPILIAIGATLLLSEKIPRWVAVGAVVAFAGVVLIGVTTSFVADGARPIDPVGVLWCVAAAITYAIGVLAQKPLVARIPSAQVTLIGCAIGMIACLPFVGQLVSDLATAPTPVWIGILYLGIVPTALAFTTWGYALSRMPASQLGISTYLVPPIAIALAWAFFQEVPAVLAFVGGVICLAGVAISRRPVRARVPQP